MTRLAAVVPMLVLALCACGPRPAPPPKSGPGAALQQLLDEEWERSLRESPLTASYLGDKRYNDRWDEVTPQAFERRHQAERAALERLKGIDRAALDPEQQLNYDLFRAQLELSVEGYAFGGHLRPVEQRNGLQLTSELVELLRFEQRKDYEDYLARLRSFGRYTDQTIALMREGLRRGRSYPQAIMQRVPAQIARQRVARPQDSAFYAPFVRLPDSIPAPEQEQLRAAAREAIAQQVLPAYERFERFFVGEYLPGCSRDIGLSAQPDGAAYYAYLVRYHTTTALTPEQIHDIGLREVERIRAQMLAIKDQVGFKGDLPAFFAHLRSDPRYYYRSGAELLDAYRAIAKRIDPELVRLFGRLPRTPYGVRPIPDSSAPDTTTAYYYPPAADGSRPGWYYVNLYRPETRPKWEMEALSAHESVPGHHLQLALQQELGELPKFRKYGWGYTAYVEGWGLYAESLGGELGLYADPYSKFGQLTYEMWRAVRLVVDTGLHARNWSREQAIEFFKANAAKTELDIVNEIDRYLAMPGQALAYKIGELKIQELRRRAQQRLGERFDVRAFHDALLASGAMPLDLLERNMDRWIEQQAR